ncbi:MAG: YggT family protein [Hydrogenibacillus sp.]|nr:YggT family protein [Hydrogenibacillus sp.]
MHVVFFPSELCYTGSEVIIISATTIAFITAYILQFAEWLLNAYIILIVLYVLSSWIPPLYESRLIGWVAQIVEPYLGLFRRFIPPLGMIDFSPVVAVLVYQFILAPALLIGLRTVLFWISRLFIQ